MNLPISYAISNDDDDDDDETAAKTWPRTTLSLSCSKLTLDLTPKNANLPYHLKCVIH